MKVRHFNLIVNLSQVISKLFISIVSRFLPASILMESQFEINSLYLLLLDRGDAHTFHWGFLLANSPEDGEIFHLINWKNSPDWEYEHISSDRVDMSRRLLLALKIAVMGPVLRPALRSRLSQIPIQDSIQFREKITCRVWIKEALFALDEEGYIKLTGTVDEVEEEARDEAMVNATNRRTTVRKSMWSQS